MNFPKSHLVALPRIPNGLIACYFLVGFGQGVLFLKPVSSVRAAEPTPASVPAGPLRHVELRGRVVCLAEVSHERFQTDLPSPHVHLFGFQASDGALYTILPTKFSEALLVDARVQHMDLLMKARVLPQSQILDVSQIRSIKNGVTCDVFYYCSVCNIESVGPGSCACCQGTVELQERPLLERRRNK